MPRENKSRYALLGMLNYYPMSGYDMKKMSDHSIGHFWNENFGNIYPVLRKMTDEGQVTVETVPQEGAPPRKVYTITAKGRRVFAEWMRRAPDSRKLREELLLQVFFGQWAGPEAVIDKLQDEFVRCSGIVEELEELRDHMESGENIEDDDAPEVKEIKTQGTPYWKSTVKFGLSYYRGIMNWCEETMAELGDEEKP